MLSGTVFILSLPYRPAQTGSKDAVESKEAGDHGAFCTCLLRLRHRTPPLRMLDAFNS
jgi:hypothetical protein